MKHQRTFVFSLLMLILVALTACGQVSAAEPVAEVSIPAGAVAPLEDEVVFDSTYLAENPELKVAIRYITKDEPVSVATFFADNPELIFARRYMASLEAPGHYENIGVANPAFYAANPELIFAHRYMASLEAPGRYENKSVTNPAFYAANPELIFAHRYMASLEAPR
jgi:hypothetical protein